jgi:hypothetical protein
LKMDVGDLARQVAHDRRGGLAPFMVVGTAGTTAAGVIDSLPELAGLFRLSRRCRVGRRRRRIAAPPGPSRRNRRRGFDHLRRAQMVLRTDGSRDVFLPASGRGW